MRAVQVEAVRADVDHPVIDRKPSRHRVLLGLAASPCVAARTQHRDPGGQRETTATGGDKEPRIVRIRTVPQRPNRLLIRSSRNRSPDRLALATRISA